MLLNELFGSKFKVGDKVRHNSGDTGVVVKLPLSPIGNVQVREDEYGKNVYWEQSKIKVVK